MADTRRVQYRKRPQQPRRSEVHGVIIGKGQRVKPECGQHFD